MTVLVTGGAGFIGSHLGEKINKNQLRTEPNVFIVDDFSGGNKNNIPVLSHYYQIDCRDAQKMDDLFKKFRFDVVFHLAANAAENKAQFSPIEITSRNYSAFINTLTPFIKYGGKRFVFTSSIAVYGSLQTPFKETDVPDPEDLYGITKLAAEQTLKVMSKVHGFEYVIARPHNVYGPRQNMSDPYRNVVTIWMNAKLRGEPCYIYGDGEQRRCFSYIDDVVEALYTCGFDDVVGKTFNIGADKSYSLNELAAAIGVKPVYLPERPQEVKEAISDHSEAKKHLNYEDAVSLQEGIQKTWEWVKNVGPVEPTYTEFEILNLDKIPSNWIKSGDGNKKV